MPRLNLEVVQEWPQNAWIAVLEPGAERIQVRCGPNVEFGDQWLCEAVWDGPFADSGFDRTDIIAGSGVRLRDAGAVFVSSGSTVDRLCHFTTPGYTAVSNSLACLLAHTRGELDPACSNYFNFFFSVTYGLDRYHRELPVSNGTVHFTYFDNLRWNGSRLDVIEKPGATRRFRTYDDYLGFLRGCVERIAQNMAAPERARRYSMLGTLSSGYDSTMVASLCRPFGLDEAICVRTPGGDRGQDIAEALGIEPIEVEREAWREKNLAAVPFIAADSFGEEVHFCSAEPLLTNRVLMTGYHGDKVWEKELQPTDTHLVRGDLSGLAHAEYRLQVGYINCPLPFWGARALADIHRISNSPEMRPWDIGGDYNRPICRRIAETAGVRRELFGMRKGAASRWLHAWPQYLPSSTLENYFGWLEKKRPAWRSKWRFAPILSERLDFRRMKVLVWISSSLLRIPGYYKLRLHRAPLISRVATMHNSDQRKPPITFGYRRYVFPWAVQRLVEDYNRPGSGG